MNKAMLRPTPQVALRASPRTNGSAAPVCPTSRSQAIPPQPPVRRPGFAMVNDLPSVINTLNQIIMMLNNPADNFQEVQRVTDTVRVFNPNDNQQWVDVERIMYLNLRDENTGGQIIWKY
jgi:hypothetical protein